MLNVALEAAKLGAIWDLVNGKAVWSKSRRELFGLDPDREITFDVFIESIIPEDRDRVRRSIMESLENRTGYNVELRVDLPDGARRWIRTRGRGFYDEKGKPVRMVGMSWDITEPRTIRERLRESEERLRLATDAADEAVWDWDCITGRFVSNDVYQNKFGQRQQAQCPDWPYDLMHPEADERHNRCDAEPGPGMQCRFKGIRMRYTKNLPEFLGDPEKRKPGPEDPIHFEGHAEVAGRLPPDETGHSQSSLQCG